MVEYKHNFNKASRANGALTFFIPLSLLFFIFVAYAFFPSASTFTPWVWVISLAFMGMAHGSLDLHVQRWSQTGEFKAKGWNKFGWYILLMVFTFGLFYFFPLLTTLLFLVLTAVHFGEADRVHAIECFGNSTSIPKSWAWVRGSFVVAIPSIFFTQQTWDPFYYLSQVSFNSTINQIITYFGYILLIATLSFAIFDSLKTKINWSSSAVIAFLFESVICFFWFVFLPPLLAIGGYFLAIHSTKHMLRLSHFKKQNIGNTTTFKDILTLHLDAVWLSAPAYLIVILWSVFIKAPVVPSLVYASIGFYLISTLPHHILVAKIPVRSSGVRVFPKRKESSNFFTIVPNLSNFSIKRSSYNTYTTPPADGVVRSSQIE